MAAPSRCQPRSHHHHHHHHPAGGGCRGETLGFGAFRGPALFFGDAGGFDACLVVRDRLRRGVLQCGQLRLQFAEVQRLGLERRLRGISGLLRLDHLLLGDLLQPVTLGAGDDGLVAEALRGVPRGDRVRVYRLVALDELVHRAESGEEVIGTGGGAGEEQLHGSVVSAVAVQLRATRPALFAASSALVASASAWDCSESARYDASKCSCWAV